MRVVSAWYTMARTVACLLVSYEWFQPTPAQRSWYFECLQVLSMVRGLTAPDLYAATEHNLHEFAVNVRPASPTLF